jgi:uncharacterized phage-associated protein
VAYPAASIANAFLTRAFHERRGIDPMKMQKLCYLAHGYSLVECDDALLDERFEAWKFGPVLPSLYHLLKKYRWGNVTDYVKDYDYETHKFVQTPAPTDPSVNKIVEFVWRSYGDLPAIELSDWTHEKDGPWDTVMKSEKNLVRNLDIPNDLIRDYFSRNMYSDGASQAK